MWEWFVSVRSKNISLSGPIIQAEALEVAQKLGLNEFKASNGWLESFKNRHNIIWKQVHMSTHVFIHL